VTRLEERIRSGLQETAERIPDTAPTHAVEPLRSTRPAGVWVAAAAVVAVLVLFTPILFLGGSDSGTIPAGDSQSPFMGTWVTAEADGSTPTMVIQVSENEDLEMLVHDDYASVCSGSPSTMTGTGHLQGDTELVFPAPMLTCDDGSQPESLSGPPLEEQLQNLTFSYDVESDTVTDNFGSIWTREGSEGPGPDPTATGRWPQSSAEEVAEAQERADAGDPDYTWQVDPKLVGDAAPWGAEIFARFIEEELGWEEFISGSSFSGYAYADGGGSYAEVLFIRCARPDQPPGPPVRGCTPRDPRVCANDRRAQVRDGAVPLDPAWASGSYRDLGGRAMGDAAARARRLAMGSPPPRLHRQAGRAARPAIRR